MSRRIWVPTLNGVAKVMWVTLFALLIWQRSSIAQTDPKLKKLTPEEVQAELKRVTSEIERLTNSPDAPPEWKELQKLEAERRAMSVKRWKMEEPIDARIEVIRDIDSIRTWEDSIRKLSDQKYDLQEYDARYWRVVGQKIFEARHAELAKKPRVVTSQLKSLRLTPLNYPQIDGSTSAQPLAMLIACHCFDASYGWKGVGQIRSRVLRELGGNSSSFFFFQEPEADLLEFSIVAKSDEVTSARLAVMINEVLATNVSTNQAYLNLIKGTSDLGLLARQPSPDEMEAAEKANVELQIEPCALDAFVFMVNVENPIKSLTIEQIRDIYVNKIQNWRELGQKQRQITAYQREENSGSQQLMKDLVMKDLPFTAKDSQLVGYIMSSPYLQLSRDEGGLAYSVYYYERFMSGSPRTKTIAVDGIEANAETIASRKYPLVSEVFVVTRKDLSADAPAAKLRSWLLSEEGQAVVRESGYVPLPRK